MQAVTDSDRPEVRGRFNKVMSSLLTSRFHPIVSRWFCLVDYRGRRSGRRFATPTQYVRDGDTVIIFVGRHESKAWWKNFRAESHPVRIWIRGRPHEATGKAIENGRDPQDADRARTIYTTAFPRAAKALAEPESCFVEITLPGR